MKTYHSSNGGRGSIVSAIHLSLAKVTLGFLLLFIVKPGLAQSTTSQKLEQLITAYHKVGLFNGSVLVAQKGQILLNKSSGYRNFDTQTSATENTKYLAYSITKSVTATIILKLIEDHKLSLQDKLSTFYPSLPFADSITIEHLLTHTSGLYAYNNDYSMPVESEQAMINFLKQSKLDFKPGTSWRYCNTGYYLLGFIIQKVTGMPYEKVVKNYIFTPLNMSESGFDYKNLTDSLKSKGYKSTFKTYVQEAPLYDNEELFSAGGMYTTLSDLYKFHQGMQSYKIISPSTTEKAYTPYKNNYGHGWFIETMAGRKLVSHSGGASGFRSYLIRDPESDLCIVLLCNSEEVDIVAIKKKILAILFNEPYWLPKQINLSEKQLANLEGAFQYGLEMTFYVQTDNGRLLIMPSRQPSAILLPQTDSTFYIDKIDGKAEFKKNKLGEIDTLVLEQKGKKYTLPKASFQWGIVGSATPNGWAGADIVLKADAQQKGRWIVHNILLKDGEIKFRVNNDWTLSYGGTDDQHKLEKGGQNIRVVAGCYNVILDLIDVDKPTYRIEIP